MTFKKCYLKCRANSLGFRNILVPETFRGMTDRDEDDLELELLAAVRGRDAIPAPSCMSSASQLQTRIVSAGEFRPSRRRRQPYRRARQ